MEEGETIVYGSRTPVMGIEYDWSSRSWTGEAVRSKGDSEQQSASLEFNSPTLAIRDPRARSQNRRLIYDFPLPEETGAWIPVSVPPNRLAGVGSVSQGRNAFAEDGGWFTDRAEYDEARESLPEVNLWNVLNGFIQIIAGRNVPQMSNEDMSTQTWPELSHRYSSRSGLVTPEYPWAHCHTPSAPPFITGSDLDVHARREVFDAEPPEWVPDSAASACMQCSTNFRALSCGRHHCRFCGGIFCRRCSSGRSLLPVKFQERDPQRVCDVCWERLEPIQQFLVDRVSNAAQSAVYDVTDMSCMRAWINSPLGLTMEHEIYKATNSLRSYYMVGEGPDKSIPDAVLDGAKGLAILTVLKVGLMVTYKMGTGLVVARKSDGTWSAPSAIASCGLGWGAQAGGELTDFIIVLQNVEAVKAFSGKVHLAMGAGLSIAAGPIGRVAEADLRAGDGGTTACYTYSRSKGAFVGCSLEGNVVATRSSTNGRFYGNSSITAIDILMGEVPPPRAATPLYNALGHLFAN